jgi:NADPH2:quinone reductase
MMRYMEALRQPFDTKASLMSKLPATMKAIVAEGAGGPDVLCLVERPLPQPGQGELVVKVAVAGVNRPDVIQRQGSYPPPPGAPDILGLEFSGEVVLAGDGVSRFRTGDSVIGLVPGGGYAQYAVVHETNALPVPAGLSPEQAGAVAETYFTVWSNVFQRGALQPGEWFLVHGGTSGIGTTAIQLAKAFGAKVIATAGSASKCDACRQLGADRAVNYRDEDFVKVVKDVTGGAGANVILDMVGGDYIGRNYEAAARDGRIVQIAFLNGSRTQVDFTRLMMKRLNHTGSTLRARPVSEKAEIARALEDHVWPLLAAGRCLPVIDSVFALSDAAEAHRRMEQSGHVGKIVLRP